MTDRKLKKHLTEFITAVEECISALDKEMEKPSSSKRGQRIATICNHLEMAKDQAKHFGLEKPL